MYFEMPQTKLLAKKTTSTHYAQNLAKLAGEGASLEELNYASQ